MLVTSLRINNFSNNAVSFKGQDFYVLIQANERNLLCQIPADAATGNIARLRKDAPYLTVEVLGTGEGVPTDNRIGAYTPVVLGDADYQGLWDASSGTPPSSAPQAGWYWRVSEDGSTELSGINEWYKNDYVKWSGLRWMRVVSMAHSHNGMSDLQGGSGNQRYHLTQQEHSYLSGQNQSVKTTSSPQFASITLTDPIAISCT